MSQRPACFFAQLGFSGCEHRADGQPDRAHFVPAQRLRHAGIDPWADDRTYTYSCRRHHHMLDHGFITLGSAQYPESFQAWARENHWFYASPRSGWLQEANGDCSPADFAEEGW